MLDKEFFVGSLLDGAGDALAVLGAEDEGAEDEEVESALEEFEFVFVGWVLLLGRHLTRVWGRFG